jgi:hypothetical protein
MAAAGAEVEGGWAGEEGGAVAAAIGEEFGCVESWEHYQGCEDGMRL